MKNSASQSSHLILIAILTVCFFFSVFFVYAALSTPKEYQRYTEGILKLYGELSQAETQVTENKKLAEIANYERKRLRGIVKDQPGDPTPSPPATNNLMIIDQRSFFPQYVIGSDMVTTLKRSEEDKNIPQAYFTLQSNCATLRTREEERIQDEYSAEGSYLTVLEHLSKIEEMMQLDKSYSRYTVCEQSDGSYSLMVNKDDGININTYFFPNLENQENRILMAKIFPSLKDIQCNNHALLEDKMLIYCTSGGREIPDQNIITYQLIDQAFQVVTTTHYGQGYVID